jgi:hypothetical protein
VHQISPDQQPTITAERRLQQRTAEEQFLEQTPWANPQHPAHASASIQNFHTQTSHFVTPAIQSRKVEIPNSHGSASTIDIQTNPPSAAGPLSIMPDHMDSPSLGLKVHKVRNNSNDIRPESVAPQPRGTSRLLFRTSSPPTNKANGPEIIGPTPQRAMIAGPIANGS